MPKQKGARMPKRSPAGRQLSFSRSEVAEVEEIAQGDCMYQHMIYPKPRQPQVIATKSEATD